MFVINRKSKRGGFWDNEAKKVVAQITIDDAEKADEYEKNGYGVTSVEDKKNKSKQGKKTKDTAEDNGEKVEDNE